MHPDPQIRYHFDPKRKYPYFLIRNRLLGVVRKFAPRLSGRLLDFGCGVKPYEHLFTVNEYVGVDYQGEGETWNKEKVDFIYNGRTLPFPDASFDSIFSSEVLEHVFNPAEIIPELHRVLKPGGRMLLTFPFAMPEHEEPNDYARYTSFAAVSLFQQHGFEVMDLEKTGNYVEAVTQLWIIWFQQGIEKRFQRRPKLQQFLSKWVYRMANGTALFFSKRYPGNKRLYLNNVLLLQKPAST
ncbi:class I SAM-dependent methyltransferase [Flaviaesturariibacter amylovorans]|uniref:Methyltransferase type 11 domain-containing protein n=1 Tax=Flaviaesturariibacter amylovorans TaxID=1084520 RepID=A0ABP8H414_9BACT